MSAALSTLGVVHTAVSVLPIGLGLAAFVRDGKIDYRNWVGKSYWWTMFAASVLSLGIFRNGTFGLPHVLTVVTLVVLFAALTAPAIEQLGRWGAYVETAAFTTSYLLVLVFATTETFTRVPFGQPLAKGPEDPLLAGTHAALFLGYLAGLAWQLYRQHAAQADVSRLQSVGA